jgi:hypothetical protein
MEQPERWKLLCSPALCGKKCCYFAEPDTGTKLKGKNRGGSEALRLAKAVEVVCPPPVWRMLRRTLAYFGFLLAELDTRNCERVVAKMACMEKKQ